MNFTKHLQIAIDGPVGAGKGTVANILRKKIGASDIYTGGSYRAVALFCLKNDIDVTDQNAVKNALSKMEIEIVNDRIFLNGEDVSESLKKSEVANATPKVASIREVRDAMIAVQKIAVAKEEMRHGKIIVEGRDIATNVLPNADLKVFLTAGSEVRARRRMIQLEDFGETPDFERVKNEVIERDRLDTERENDPLSSDPASMGYFVVDNSSQHEEETAEVIIEEMRRRSLI